MNAELFSVRLPDGQNFGPVEMPVLQQWAREGRVPREAQLVPVSGGPPRRVIDEPALAPLVLAPPTVSSGVLALPQDTPGPALIPFKNPPALIGYYLAVFSLLPVIGLPLGIVAVILGIVGLFKRHKNPGVRGMAHALVAIILGGLTTLLWGGGLALLLLTGP